MRRNTRLNPAGYIVISDPESGVVEADTLQCVHCGYQWQIKPGSGKVRGFCSRCNGPICGPKCVQCVPIERGLDNLEAGRAEKECDGRVTVGGIWMP